MYKKLTECSVSFEKQMNNADFIQKKVYPSSRYAAFLQTRI